MNKTEQAQQLRLAAELIETEHPWECSPDHFHWLASKGKCPIHAIRNEWKIRPILATPPDNRPLHNPDNLTAEQVGIGYRLLTQDEFRGDMHLEHQEWWSICFNPDTWIKTAAERSRGPAVNYNTTYRLPLSVPWPEPKPSPPPEPATRTVELGPEDIVTKLKEAIAMLETLTKTKV